MRLNVLYWSALALLMAGCKVVVTTGDTGDVISESSAWVCTADRPCEINISTATFDETFLARPDSGFQFTGWKRADGYLCGGSLNPCRLVTTGFVGNDGLLAVLESDRQFQLEPGFIPEDHVRRYAEGDVVRLSGSLTLETAGSAPVTTQVAVRFEMLASTLSYRDQPVLLWRTRIRDIQTGSERVHDRHVWQAADGTLLEIADHWGNVLLDADTDATGLLAWPVPLVANDYREVAFYILFGGHTSGPIAEGTRSIQVADAVNMPVPGGEAAVYRVTHEEQAQFLYTWSEFQRGDVVESQRVLSLAPVKGIVALQESVAWRSDRGDLKERISLDVQAVATNF